jgi:GT2 family glycosyltransferase
MMRRERCHHDGDFSLGRRYFTGTHLPAIIVAVPARNEAERIERCLAALANQRDLDGTPFTDGRVGVLVLLNNCTDQSFEVALSAFRPLAGSVRLYDVVMRAKASHAGGARRAAMDLAAEWLDEGCHADGLILTTDADSEPKSDWIAANRAAILRGVDGVAGTTELDPDDTRLLPDIFHARALLEAHYGSLLTELFSHLDPRPHDPWPRHASEPGASLAVTLHAYRAIGGLPCIALGEDGALVASLERSGMRVRHDPAVRVVTSGRIAGRAQGGVADTIRIRCDSPDALCDPYLEPARDAFFRGLWRGRMRTLHAGGLLGVSSAWMDPLDLPPDGARELPMGKSFAVTWGELERISPRLARRPLTPRDLPGQIHMAKVMLQRLRRALEWAPRGQDDIQQSVADK